MRTLTAKLIAKDVVGKGVNGADASFCKRLNCLSSRPTRAPGKC